MRLGVKQPFPCSAPSNNKMRTTLTPACTRTGIHRHTREEPEGSTGFQNQNHCGPE